MKILSSLPSKFPQTFARSDTVGEMQVTNQGQSSLELRSEAENVPVVLEYPDGIPSQSLGPVDQGRRAWTVLIAGVVFEALFWGE